MQISPLKLVQHEGSPVPMRANTPSTQGPPDIKQTENKWENYQWICHGQLIWAMFGFLDGFEQTPIGNKHAQKHWNTFLFRSIPFLFPIWIPVYSYDDTRWLQPFRNTKIGKSMQVAERCLGALIILYVWIFRVCQNTTQVLVRSERQTTRSWLGHLWFHPFIPGVAGCGCERSQAQEHREASVWNCQSV